VNDWRGLIALVLSVGVAVALVAGVLTAELTPTKVTSEEIAFLSTLGGASVGAVAAYLGIRHRGDDEPPEPPEPEQSEEEEP
jgi:branched-subunit amino acid ABC-type transport system permease component